MPLIPEDAFTLWLKGQGITPKVYSPAARFGGIPIGWQIPIGKSTFVYRLPPERPGVFIIILFERQGERSGLRSPFGDFVRLLSLIKRAGIGIHTIEGHVEAVKGRPADSLLNEQIVHFYKRYLLASQVRVENEVEWVAGDLTTYVPPLAAARKQASKDSAPSADGS